MRFWSWKGCDRLTVQLKAYNRLLAAGLCFSLLATTGSPAAHATGLDDLESQKTMLENEKEQIAADRESKEQNYQKNDDQIATLLRQIEELDQRITDSTSAIESLEDDLMSSMIETGNLHLEIQELQGDATKRDNVLRERMKQLQLQGPTSYLDVLLGAENFSDFIDRFSSVQTLLSADRHLMEQQHAATDSLNAKKEQLDGVIDQQRDKKASIDHLLSEVQTDKEVKSTLIVTLEQEQERLEVDIATLDEAFEEAESETLALEQQIVEEQRRAITEWQGTGSSPYCTSDGTVDHARFSRSFQSAGILSGQQDLIRRTAEKFSIDPVLMGAIILQETGNGQSDALNYYFNPGGLMDSATNWQTLLRFDSLEQGLMSMGRTLDKLVNTQGKDSIQELGAVYAPLNAANDPLGLNAYWVPNVTKKVEELGGLSSNCDPQLSSTDSNADWLKPAAGRLTSQFGWRIHPIFHTKKQHRGLDIASPVGTPVMASKEGVVTRAGVYGGYGNVVMLTHEINGQIFTSVYGHLSSIEVGEGQQVRQGQLLGASGQTGNSTGPHLHFEIHEGYYSVNGPSAVNPLLYINASGGS